MIEIVALFFLCRMNGKLAVQKGLKQATWRIYTIIAWLVAEITGVFLGMILFGKDNLGALMAFGVMSACGGYLYIRYILEKKPGIVEDDINKIGIDDLRPPKK